MTESGSPYEERYLTEDDISAELLADTLSDVPDDADSDSDSSVYLFICILQICTRLNEPIGYRTCHNYNNKPKVNIKSLSIYTFNKYGYKP